MGNFRKIPGQVRKPSADAWYLEPSKSVLYNEYFGLDAPLGSTGQIKFWNGTAWTAKPVKVWNGTSWVVKPVKRWNGTAWVTTTY